MVGSDFVSATYLMDARPLFRKADFDGCSSKTGLIHLLRFFEVIEPLLVGIKKKLEAKLFIVLKDLEVGEKDYCLLQKKLLL